jgi:hypothetical protein
VFEAELNEIDSANATSVIPNFIATNSNSPATSPFSSNPTYVASPGPSANSRANDNLNMFSRSTDTSIFVASPKPSHTFQEKKILMAHYSKRIILMLIIFSMLTNMCNINCNIQ